MLAPAETRAVESSVRRMAWRRLGTLLVASERGLRRSRETYSLVIACPSVVFSYATPTSFSVFATRSLS
jgi:hypothetical protein